MLFRFVLFVAAVTPSTALWPGTAAAAQAGDGSRGKVVLYFAGKPVTFRDLTGVSYRKTLKKIDQLVPFISPPANGDWPAGGQVMLPSYGPFFNYRAAHGSSVRTDLLGIFHLLVQDAVDSFLVGRVQALFNKSYPFDYAKHFHLRRVHSFEMIIAESWQAFQQADVDCVIHRWTVAQYAAALRRALPAEPASRLAKWAAGRMPSIIKHPDIWLMESVLPLVVRGHITPWARFPTFYAICPRFPMRAALRPRVVELRRLVDKRLAESRMVIVDHARPSENSGIVKIINLCLGKGQSVNLRRLDKAQRCLYFLGSPTRMRPAFGTYEFVSQITGLPDTQIRFRQPEPQKQGGGFVYIYYLGHKQGAAFYALNPASFLWDFGEEQLLLPLAKKVLSRTRLAVPWLKMPTSGIIARACYAGVGATQRSIFGKPLPRLIRKKYLEAKW
ncbi:MAG: hypothetical protein ACP5O7_11620 [Phycisphaerae bacterium]